MPDIEVVVRLIPSVTENINKASSSDHIHAFLFVDFCKYYERK